MRCQGTPTVPGAPPWFEPVLATSPRDLVMICGVGPEDKTSAIASSTDGGTHFSFRGYRGRSATRSSTPTLRSRPAKRGRCCSPGQTVRHLSPAARTGMLRSGAFSNVQPTAGDPGHESPHPGRRRGIRRPPVRSRRDASVIHCPAHKSTSSYAVQTPALASHRSASSGTLSLTRGSSRAAPNQHQSLTEQSGNATHIEVGCCFPEKRQSVPTPVRTRAAWPLRRVVAAGGPLWDAEGPHVLPSSRDG